MYRRATTDPKGPVAAHISANILPDKNHDSYHGRNAKSVEAAYKLKLFFPVK